MLGAVRAQFGQFGDVLVKVQKRLQSASESIDNATRKSRRIEGACAPWSRRHPTQWGCN